MRRLLLALPLLALLGCPQTPWCDRLNPDQPGGLQTCVYADEVLDRSRPFSTEEGYPVDFLLQEIDARADQDSLADGTRLTGQPWGLTWSVASGDPTAERVVDRIRRTTVRADSIGQVVAVAVSPDESHYALGLADGRFVVRTLDHATVLDGRAAPGLVTVAGLEVPNAMTTLAFSADGRLLLTGDRQQHVDLWALTGGGHRWDATLSADVRALAVSADGRFAAAGTSDGTVTVWDAATGSEVASWTHPQSVGHVAFTDDGTHVVARLRGTYHAPNQATASDLNPVTRSQSDIQRAQSGSHDGFTGPDLVAVWRLP